MLSPELACQGIHRLLHGQDDRLLVVIGPCSIHDVDAAKDYARARATELVRRKAHGSGAGRFHIRLHVEDRQASINPGGVLYVETRVVAQAVGAPRVA